MDERAQKVMELALNSAAGEGEWQAAFRKIRARAGTVAELIELLAEPPDLAEASPPLPFGKYKGYTVREVWQNDPGYLEWLYRNCQNLPDWLKRAVAKQIGA